MQGLTLLKQQQQSETRLLLLLSLVPLAEPSGVARARQLLAGSIGRLEREASKILLFNPENTHTHTQPDTRAAGKLAVASERLAKLVLNGGLAVDSTDLISAS